MRLFLALATIFFPVLLSAQSAKFTKIQEYKPKQALTNADTAYAKLLWDDAYLYYKMGLSASKKHKAKHLFRYAYCALMVRDYVTSEKAFQELLLSKKAEDYEQLHYYYGQTLKHVGKYTEAEAEFVKYMKRMEKYPNSELYLSALNNTEVCRRASTMSPRSENFTVNNAGGKFNSYDDDIAPCMIGDSLYLTCYNALGYNMEFVKEERARFKGAMSNPIYGYGNLSLKEGTREVFFTKSQGNIEKGFIQSIYSGTLNDQGQIVNERLLEPSINAPGFCNSHPTYFIGPLGQEVLYFSSNRTGGYGGFDIWYSIKLADGKWGTAWNAGKRINTPESEITPYYSKSSELLYFASSRRDGLGGYDIYKIQGEKSTWFTNAYRYGFPINSSADEYYPVFYNPNTGWFSSNRNGGLDGAYQNCCDDLYKIGN